KDLDGPYKKVCQHITANKCMRINDSEEPCIDKLHYVRRSNEVYNLRLGDCSYLSGCYNYDTCPFVHYTEQPAVKPQTVFEAIEHSLPEHLNTVQKSKPPAQWINTDISVLPMKVLGKFDVVLIDPPWPIHMKLPYHQMTDQDIMSLPIQHLQDNGLIFLWVTSRALEKGIQCLEKWGYIFTSYITWAKTNQINSTIATGRTGHWLNHMKETCLVGRKGNIELNNGLDGDVIIEQVRETSRKPEKLYTMIERLVGDNARKLELFGRQHNLRHGW
ncbi:MT-A70-domain-containing protein, partial [Wilcoxina mikolae CBS 423.85]